LFACAVSALPDSNDKTNPNDYNTIPEAPSERRAAFAEWLASPQNSSFRSDEAGI